MASSGQVRDQLKYSGRYRDLVEGRLSIEDLDTEELAKGRLKDKDGKFRGRPPKFLPRQLVDAMRSEHYKRVNGILEESLSDMVKTMRAIAKNEDVDPATRLKAAIYVYERFMGKTPETIKVLKGDKVQDVVDRIMYDIGESPIEKEIAATKAEMDTPASSVRRSASARARRAATRTSRNR